MDFWQTILVVVRRWYIAVPAFLVSIAIAAAVYANVPVLYKSTGVIVLATPITGASQAAEPDRPSGLTNPFLNFDQGLSLSASILIQALNTPEIAADLGAPASGDTWFQVTNGTPNPELLANGPFLFIEGNSSSAERARDIVAKVMERARAELVDRQHELKAPPSTFITAVDVVPPTTPEALRGSRSRAAGAAGMLGIIAGLAAAYAFESVATARRRRRATTRPAPAPPDSPALVQAGQH